MSSTVNVPNHTFSFLIQLKSKRLTEILQAVRFVLIPFINLLNLSWINKKKSIFEEHGALILNETISIKINQSYVYNYVDENLNRKYLSHFDLLSFPQNVISMFILHRVAINLCYAKESGSCLLRSSA